MAESSQASRRNAIKIAVAVAALLIAVVLLTQRGGGGQTFEPGDYHYDLATGEVATQPGPQRPVAMVVTCGACTPEQWQVAFIRKSEDGESFVAAPAAEPKWVRAEFPEGRDLVERISTMCDGEGATPCRPTD